MKVKGRLSQLVLGITNLVYFFAGIAVVVVGGLALSNPSALNGILRYVPIVEQLEGIVDFTNIAENPAIYLTVIGSIVIVLSLVGCGGVFKKHKIVMAVYGIITTLMMLLNIAVIMFCAIDPYNRLGSVQKSMTRTLEQNFEPISFTVNGNIVYPMNDDDWNRMQFLEGCCGVINSTDYLSVQTQNWNKTIFLPSGPVQSRIPPSCCALISPNTLPSSISDFVNITTCLTSNPSSYANNKGCDGYVMQQVNRYGYVLPVIAATLTGLQALILTLTMWLLIRNREN